MTCMAVVCATHTPACMPVASHAMGQEVKHWGHGECGVWQSQREPSRAVRQSQHLPRLMTGLPWLHNLNPLQDNSLDWCAPFTLAAKGHTTH
jgi:hypothetical protein